jgi:hypothetical protein
MRTQKIAGIMALSSLSATTLYAAQPPVSSEVQGDAFYNTAVGFFALSNDATPAKQCVPYAFNHASSYMSGCANTASGIAALQFNTAGFANTATGAGALRQNTTGAYNTAVGSLAMYNTTVGSDNAALGTGTLFANTAGYSNSAVGAYALFSNTTGFNNTSAGHNSLYYNTTGSKNTAVGNAALSFTTLGNENTAVGSASMNYNLTGNGNTASGHASLAYNVGGNSNVAVGLQAMYRNLNPSNLSSSYNTAVGAMALYNNTTSTTAGNNTAVGYQALAGNGGVGNTALGTTAGSQQTTGNYNTYLGFGVQGIAAENYVTRIGVSTIDPSISGAPTTYIAGVSSSPITGAAVYVTASGQLGVLASSERYKTDIRPLGSNTDNLRRLRPVSFHLKAEPAGTLQYGLIAEEVDKIYPELVIRDNDGRIQGVRYDELAPMLLNELQNQQQVFATESGMVAAQATALEALAAQNSMQAAKIDSLEQQVAELNDLKQELNAALGELKAQGSTVAQR